MNSKKVSFIMMGVVGTLSILGVLSIVYGNTLLQKKSDELVNLKLENELIDEQQIALIQANKDVKSYQELDQIAKTIVPQDKDQARTVREILQLAEQSQISIGSITFPSSTLGSAAASKSGSGAKKSTAPPVTQVTPVDGIQGVYQLEINLQTAEPTSYVRLIDFLNRLEQNRRTAQITTLDIRPDTRDRSQLQFDITMNVFIKP